VKLDEKLFNLLGVTTQALGNILKGEALDGFMAIQKHYYPE
jgi:hypothetical protein